MTEQEWMACADVATEEVMTHLQGKSSDRKLRLLACAFCRRVWRHICYSRELSEQDQFETIRLRAAVEIAERFADGQASPQELGEAASAALEAATAIHEESGPWAACCTTVDDMWKEVVFAEIAAWRAAAEWAAATQREGRGILSAAEAHEKSAQAMLLRDVFGPLSFRPVTLDPAWLTPTVVSLAQAIYAERAFDRLPILADALEDAGCDNADILNHCRHAGEHVRGRWPVDLLLGKQ